MSKQEKHAFEFVSIVQPQSSYRFIGYLPGISLDLLSSETPTELELTSLVSLEVSKTSMFPKEGFTMGSSGCHSLPTPLLCKAGFSLRTRFHRHFHQRTLTQNRNISPLTFAGISFDGFDDENGFLSVSCAYFPSNPSIQVMMKDQFANYVVHILLETCDDHQRKLMLKRIKVHLNAVKKYTCGPGST
ncbi:hypothetical protein RHSIM_Rhsim03G0105400 [Rhododendron simsii]|uniref:Uncharacterized protein n=1 Tax=Rhododendron simsii TaxID=118357 RepID=A0A834H4X2_RHOSS|nr:hypothetical protein RHSIM_Rhsim03G0105400 [Rhododendron simsii]